jgi:hypothetical protein
MAVKAALYLLDKMDPANIVTAYKPPPGPLDVISGITTGVFVFGGPYWNSGYRLTTNDNSSST